MASSYTIAFIGQSVLSDSYSFRAEKFKRILDSDPAMGYIVSQGLLRIIKKRYDARTRQFIRVLTNHPDLKKLL